MGLAAAARVTFREIERPLFEKRARSFAHVFGGSAQAKKSRLQILAFGERHFVPAFDHFHREFYGERRIGDDFFRQRLSSGQKFRRFVHVVHEADAQRLIR